MSAAISDKHQVVLRMIKQLDALMVRDINIAWEEFEEDIPIPTFEISSFKSSVETRELTYVPSLVDICSDLVS